MNYCEREYIMNIMHTSKHTNVTLLDYILDYIHILVEYSIIDN